jgi:hypothetical protein
VPAPRPRGRLLEREQQRLLPHRCHRRPHRGQRRHEVLCGLKVGGSFPRNASERNPCNCRMDALMFLDREASADEVKQQHRRYLALKD